MSRLATQPERNAAAPTGVVVQIQGLTKVYRDFWMRARARAVDNLDLEVREREIFGLLGPNGSGKSTTIKVILGLLHKTRGRVAVFGKPPTDVSIKKRIGVLPEESYLYPFLNARETLDYYAKLFEIDHRARKRRIDELLDMVGLTAVQFRQVKEYSKGMQRRIGLAQALINDPDFLILDEPTTGLDPIGSRQVKDLIVALGRRGKTILLSSHQLSDVEDCVDRLAILYGGKKRAEGTVDELLTARAKMTIETGELDDETIAQIDGVIRRRTGGAIERVARPRQRLEDLFIDIVERARVERIETAGAVSGGATAAFLLGDQPAQAEGDALIEKLVTGEPARAAGAAPEQPAPPAPPAGPDENVIGDLVDGAAPPLPPRAARARPEPEREPENVDRSMIDSLLSSPRDERDAEQRERPAVSVRDAAAKLDRVQKSRRFKLIATILIAALAIGGYSAWWVVLHAPSDAPGPAPVSQPAGPASQPQGAAADGDIGGRADESVLVEERISGEELRLLLGRRDASAAVGFGALAVAGVAVAIVWLGLGLTFLGLTLVAAIVAAPMLLFEGTRSFGQVVLGCVVLTAAFTALMEGMRLALSPSSPVTAIARTCLAEAVRMKISLVFIVLLIFMLATLPGLLDESQPLRYRVQSFLQYSVGGSYWVLAVMTLFFSAATVAFEQRDRIIWQTMSKPVRPWEYVLGKWLGIAALNAALLAVAGTGSFLFTEHLRGLPANEESRPYVNADGSGEPTTDRLLLASQVLVARAGAQPEVPPTPREELLALTERTVQLAKERDPTLAADPARLEQVTVEVYQEQHKQWREQLRTIPPGAAGTFEFTGLEHARAAGKPLTLRYKVQAGGNNPTSLYRLTFRVSGVALPSVQATLNTAQRLPLRPSSVEPDGRLVVDVFNGDPFTGETNPLSITFPPGDLEVLYVAGGYEINFARVLISLWIKLGFIAAVGIASATFLSFPVACLMGLLVLFAGESATFLMESLEDFHFRPNESGPIEWVNVPIRIIALPIAWAFEGYAEMDPAANLVDGRLVSWVSVLRALATVGTWTAAALAVGWAIFRKRELALYSGH